MTLLLSTWRLTVIIFISHFSSSSEIPQFRLPYDVVSYEVELMKDLGVKVHVVQSHDHGVIMI